MANHDTSAAVGTESRKRGAVSLPVVDGWRRHSLLRQSRTAHDEECARPERVDQRFRFTANEIVLQPTTFCNLDCSYCYLPERHLSHRMPVEVAQQVAEYVSTSARPKLLLWHSGEPLAVGLAHFRSLVAPFAQNTTHHRARHLVQTNATLISEDWCEFFKEHGFRIGVSIDGTRELNRRRVTRAGKEAYSRTRRGIDCLRRNGLPFSVIAVVGTENLRSAKALYAAVRDLGAEMLCVNVEETEGVNQSSLTDSARVKDFWRALYDHWRADMSLPIREFDRVLTLMRQLACSGRRTFYRSVELIPAVSVLGEVSLLSPEFMGVRDARYEFVVGNVLEDSLAEILRRGPRRRYVQEYLHGIQNCRQQCRHFDFCAGGYASNKCFENHDLTSTETVFCRNKEKALVDALMEAIEDECE